MKKVLLTTVMSLMMCMGVFAQDYMNAPKANEKVIGTISIDKIENDSPDGHITSLGIYKRLIDKAKSIYSDYQQIEIRNLNYRELQETRWWPPYADKSCINCWCNFYDIVDVKGTVVVSKSQDEIVEDSFRKAISKSFRSIREGSRLAFDQVIVLDDNINRENAKDLFIDVLLNRGYKVVAKEYLERLYEEQQVQQSGIYNERTTVQENNFSAVGYYINVKVTETSLRVQVVNVSTGEYEGNATVNF